MPPLAASVAVVDTESAIPVNTEASVGRKFVENTFLKKSSTINCFTQEYTWYKEAGPVFKYLLTEY